MVIFLIFSILALAIDLITKQIAFDYFEKVAHSTPVIDSFLYWTRVENTGVAFGMMQGKNDLLSYILPVVLIGLPIYIFFNRHEGKVYLCLMGFVYGGALGNYYDRVFIGYVRDFIDVRFGSYDYPVFNIADAFISCSVVLMFCLSWLQSRKNKPNAQT